MKENRGIRGSSATNNPGGFYSITDVNNLTPVNTYTLEIICVGGGGGGGGSDGISGAGGASGAIVSGSLTVSPGKLFYIGVAGGGGAGTSSGAQVPGGAGGINGGGDGGYSGGTPSSGAGGAGGGWSGLYSGKTYYIIAGGGAGGGGANEGLANDIEALGGGKQVAVTNSLNGSPGVIYLGDGGGGAGGGGGYWGGRGQANISVTFDGREILSLGGYGNTASGGGVYYNPSMSGVEIKLGNNGPTPGTAGAANTATRFGYVPGSAGSGAGGAGGSAGTKGNVIIRYAGARRGFGGTVNSAGGYTYHMFTSEANIFGSTTFIT